MYPGPSKGEWGNWWRGNSKQGTGKGDKGGAANAFTQGTALDTLRAAGLCLSMFAEVPAVTVAPTTGKLSTIACPEICKPCRIAQPANGWKVMPRAKTWKKSFRFDEAIHTAAAYTHGNRFEALPMTNDEARASADIPGARARVTTAERFGLVFPFPNLAGRCGAPLVPRCLTTPPSRFSPCPEVFLLAGRCGAPLMPRCFTTASSRFPLCQKSSCCVRCFHDLECIDVMQEHGSHTPSIALQTD